MVLPAPCHNGWAKGSGWVHAGSSVGNLSEQSVATRRVKKMFNKFSTKIMCRTFSKSQVQHFFFGFEPPWRRVTVHHGLVPAPSHKP